MNANNSALCVLATFSLLLAMPASANLLGKDKGLYVGVAAGGAATQVDDGPIDIDDTQFAYKFFGGYQFNALFAIEGGYNNFGEPGDNGVDVETDGIALFGLVGIPIGPVRAFVKGGAISWDADFSSDLVNVKDDDGTDVAYGVGLDFELFSLGWRAEYERFEIGDGIDQATIGLTFTF